MVNKETTVILGNFEEYIQVELKNALTRSPLGKVLEYTQKFLPKIKLILEDASLEIDNNADEMTFNPFVIKRKTNFFQYAQMVIYRTILYSVIETAKANNLIVEKYLINLINSLREIYIKTESY
ncbi:IS66 family transposase [Clostridium perfringens]|uniref:IS66 family transposase n=1 Tax=Clostridium perfringens TaxID=1502 RepID=UPI001CCA59B5|nr:transposase [Clostridium perfringens]MCC2766125.1 transposase [Clostridium perfringens]MDM0570121.1 transposase [Clostridium perfringens]MDM0572764.1 transposase [Clostridium perfringens]MDM0584733.1 transposase [Clostridium perfringens]UBK64848.1 transposase [Clostridium perfringens]